MNPVLRTLTALMLIATFFGGAASAHAESRTPVSDATEDPAQLVVKLSSNIIEAVRTDKSVQSGDATAVQKLVEEHILPYVNFEKTTRLAVGRAWRQATADQRAQLTTEFRTLLIRTYAGALSTVREHKVRLVLTRKEEADVVVRTEVRAPRGDPIQIDYRLEQTETGW